MVNWIWASINGKWSERWLTLLTENFGNLLVKFSTIAPLGVLTNWLEIYHLSTVILKFNFLQFPLETKDGVCD